MFAMSSFRMTSITLFMRLFLFQIKEEPADTEEGDKWSILRDDFMMGAKMKDWDKENSGDEGGGQVEMEGDNDDIDDMTDSE